MGESQGPGYGRDLLVVAVICGGLILYAARGPANEPTAAPESGASVTEAPPTPQAAGRKTPAPVLKPRSPERPPPEIPDRWRDPDSTAGHPLPLDAGSGDIENRLSITLPESELSKLSATRKVELVGAGVRVNGARAKVLQVKIRGRGSLSFARKSLTVKLEDPVSITRGARTKALSSFFALSLNMDQGYFRSVVALHLLTRLGLFSQFHALCELSINGRSEGLYLLVQRTKSWVFDEHRSAFLARRREDGKIRDEVKFKKKRSPFSLEQHRAALNEVLQAAHSTVSGEALYRQLAGRLDMDRYLDYLAFNALVRNGDYTGELFFYSAPGKGPIRFGVVGWDFDDLFSREPHEGWGKRILHAGLWVYSVEDPLDRRIATDPYLYARYLERLRLQATWLRSNASASFQAAYQALAPYYGKPTVLAQAQRDKSKTTLSLQWLRERLQLEHARLVTRAARAEAAKPTE